MAIDNNPPGRRGSPGDFEAQWRARFETFGRSYETDAEIAGWTENGLATRMRNFEDRLGTIGGAWLDAGCGAGTYVRMLANCGAETVFGLDYSRPSLEKAKALSNGAQGTWINGDANHLPFRSESFDGVVCFGVTQALADSATLVSELARVARPGGQIWVDGLNRGCVPDYLQEVARRLRRQPMRVRYEDPGLICRRLAAAGCDRTEVVWVPIVPGRFGKYQYVVERLGLARRPGLGPALSHAFIVRGRKGEA